ncbi:MAG: WYL domain-containing protein [Clostridiales bacterium]|jgi:predicted DNA-binding transcriptional regulator YafY|nr:WYL domain-containing protein [Clostridiales bacterium]
MQNSVIFGILITIINKGKVTREYLCQKFEVSKRTIARYIDILYLSNIPLISIPGRNGGISIEDDFVLSKTFLTYNERARLLTCVKASNHAFDDTTNFSIIQKLEEAQKRHNNSKTTSYETIYVDTHGTCNNRQYKHNISNINLAINSIRSIQLEYTGRLESTHTRYLDPYCLVLRQNIWYVYGICHTQRDFVLLRLSRISNIVVGTDTFERKIDINISEMLQHQSERPQVSIRIEFSNLRLHDVVEWLGADSVQQDQLKYTAQAIVDSGPELLSRLLSFGSDIRVLSPIWLKVQLVEECNRMIDYNTLV